MRLERCAADTQPWPCTLPGSWAALVGPWRRVCMTGVGALRALAAVTILTTLIYLDCAAGQPCVLCSDKVILTLFEHNKAVALDPPRLCNEAAWRLGFSSVLTVAWRFFVHA